MKSLQIMLNLPFSLWNILNTEGLALSVNERHTAKGHSKIQDPRIMKHTLPWVMFQPSHNDTENNKVKNGCVTCSLTSQNWPFFLRAFILATVESRKVSSSKIKYPLGIILEIKPLQKWNNNMLKSVLGLYLKISIPHCVSYINTSPTHTSTHEMYHSF